MNVLLWAGIGVFSFSNGYLLALNRVALTLGREISNSSTGTGFQDAITPPWTSNVRLLVWAASATCLIALFLSADWKIGLVALATWMILSVVAQSAMFKAVGNRFQEQIVRSMISRYADYRREGDTLRADAMKELLERAGIPLD